MMLKDYTTQEGLPDSRVAPIAQDSEGYMWFGTQGGLARYDGQTFQRMTGADDIPGIFGRSMAVDHQGGLWFACSGFENGKIMRVYRGSVTTFPSIAAFSSDQPVSIVEDSARCIWCATGSRLFRVRFTGGYAVAHIDKFLTPGVTSLLVARDGTLWCGGNGVWTYRNGAFTDELGGVATGENFLVRPYGMYESFSGDIWAGGHGGLVRISGSTRTFFSQRDGLPAKGIWSLQEDHEGNFWVGTAEGLYRAIVHGADVTFRREPSFGNSIVYDICLDREGNVWFASAPGVRKLLASDLLVSFPGEDVLSTPGFGPITQLRDGSIIFGSRNSGLYKLTNGRLTFGESVPPFTSLTYTSICTGAGSAVWFGLKFGGAYRLDGGHLAHYGPAEGLPSPHVYALAGLPGDDMLLGTGSGLCITRGGRLHRLSHTGVDSLVIFDIHVLPPDEGGRTSVWLATNHGLVAATIDRDSIVTVFPPVADSRTASSILYKIFQNRAGVFWFATDGNGLLRWDGSSLLQYTSDDGLAGNRVYAIAEDSVGTMWIGTSSGLSQFDGSSFRSFRYEDGFEEIGLNGLLTDRAGRLWVSSLPGIKCLEPHRYYKSGLPPPISITRITVDTSLVQPSRNFDISPDHAVITFHYAGLSFTDEEDVRYRYHLNGFDAEWSPPVKAREVRYTHLPPGSYTFEVVARSRDNVWSPLPAAVSFTVLPPLWARWWFLTLAAIASVVGMHPVYLAREFRKHFRCTVGQYQRRLRIESACLEISRSDTPLAEVAAAVGFYDQSHFSRTFKRITGLTPAEYRAVFRAG